MECPNYHKSVVLNYRNLPEEKHFCLSKGELPDILSAIEGAMKIKDLWYPSDDWSKEHKHEAVALQKMHKSFKSILEYFN